MVKLQTISNPTLCSKCNLNLKISNNDKKSSKKDRNNVFPSSGKGTCGKKDNNNFLVQITLDSNP